MAGDPSSLSVTPLRRAKPADRLAEFKEWARAQRPGVLEQLMPEGKLDPALEKAEPWKAAGLEIPKGLDANRTQLQESITSCG
jgi:hypothetical protein